MKKILFVVDYIYSGYTTNIKLTQAVSSQLKDRYEIIYLCNAKENPMPNESVTIFTSYADKASYDIVNRVRHGGGNVISTLVEMFKKPKALLNVITSVIFKYSLAEGVFKKKIEEVCRQNKISAVVSISCPHYVMFALANSNITAKKIAYIMDPYSLNDTLSYIASKEKEIDFFNKIDQAVVTDLMYEQYKNSEFSKFLKKMTVAQFPALTKRKNIIKEGGAINCVYVGNLYPKIRDPRYLFEIAEKLEQNITFNFYGGGYEGFPVGYFSSYVSKFAGRLSINDSIDSKTAEKILSEADILINLGNSIDNQLPSKVIEYMGYCKPILNIYKLDNCPSLNFYNKYPAALNVKDGDINNKTIEEINRFIVSKKRTTINYSDIELLFPECTPAYVANQFDQILEEI